jgi:serine/threonine protein kinase
MLAEEEYDITQHFKLFDKDLKYFIYPEDMCSPDLIKSDEDDYDSCTSINLTKKYFSAPKILIFEDGGVDLFYISVSNKDYLAFFEGVTNLLKGLVLLHKNNFVHMDIKPSNIVGKKDSDGKYILRYIDFGLTDKVSVASKNLYAENYSYWPYDIKLLTDRFEFDLDDLEKYYDVQEESGKYYPFWSIYDDKNTYKINEAFANALNESILSGKIDEKEIIKSIDIFGLGRSLFEIYGRLLRHRWVSPGEVRIENAKGRNKIHELIKNDISKPLYELLESMIHFNPLKRPTAVMVLERYEQILPAMKLHFPKL